MSRVFITGRLTLEELEEEHGAEYDQLVASGKIPEHTEKSEAP